MNALYESLPATVLVVDDDRDARALLATRLEAEGFRVVAVPGIRAGLQAMRERSVDAVLLDVRMPDIGGLDALRLLRHRFDATELPVLMVAASADPDDMVRCLQAGANDYVPKPIDLGVLVARLRMHLAMQRGDAVTGLPSRRTLAGWLERALAEADARVGLAVMDLDFFRLVNDRHGLDHGDRFLRAFALRLAQALPAGAIAARLGGDAFGVAWPGVPDAQALDAARSALAEAFEDVVWVDGAPYTASMTTGLALFPTDGATGEALVGAAERAMIAAKRERGGHGFAAA